jgi:very-short-patch-repair endonuclease
VSDDAGVDLSLLRRRDLRRDSTDAERLLWKRLRDRRLLGFKFRRQYPCGPFILDFFCPEKRVAIELDGGQHFEASVQAYDERRTAFLGRRGITVIRFQTDLVFRELTAVLESIVGALRDGPSP